MKMKWDSYSTKKMATNQMHTRLFPCFKDDSFDFYKKRVSNEKKKKARALRNVPE